MHPQHLDSHPYQAQMYSFRVLLENVVFIISRNPQSNPTKQVLYSPPICGFKPRHRIIKYTSIFTQALSDEAISKPEPSDVRPCVFFPGSPAGQLQEAGFPWGAMGLCGLQGRHSHRTQCKWCPLVSCKTEG